VGTRLEAVKKEEKPRLVVGITGASGAPLAVAVLEALRKVNTHEIHLVISEGGERLLREETGSESLELVRSLADTVHDDRDTGASIASGSFKTQGMIIVPCSMKTLAAVRCGFSSTLIVRAADVTIKERRRLILVPRETPFSPIHLDNMSYLAGIGVTIMPPVMGFYYKAKTIEEMVHQLAGKIVEPFVGDIEGYYRWNGAT